MAFSRMLCVIWGSTWFVIKEGLRDLPPFTSAGARFAVASVAMVLATPALRRAEGGAAPAVWIWVTLGLSNFAISYGVVYWCEIALPSGLVSVLWAVFPLIMAVAGHLYLPGERLVARQWAGFAIGFAGVALLFETDLRAIGPSAVSVALVLLISPCAAALGTTLVKKHASHTSSAVLNRNGMAVGAVALFAVAGVTERSAPVAWTANAVFSVLYLALAGTCVTFTLYFWLLRYARASRLSLIAFVTPCIALALGAAFGGEAITPFTVGGTLLVFAGVWLVLRGGILRRDKS